MATYLDNAKKIVNDTLTSIGLYPATLSAEIIPAQYKLAYLLENNPGTINGITVLSFLVNSMPTIRTDALAATDGVSSFITTNSEAANTAVTNTLATLPAVEVEDLLNGADATYTIEAASGSVFEGEDLVFTVTANGVLAEDYTLKYQIVEGSTGTAATPSSDLGILNGTVTILAGQSEGTFTLTPTSDSSTEGYETFAVSLLNADFAPVVTSNNVTIKDPLNAGSTFMLTTGVDGAPAFTGGAGDDIYTGVIDGTTTTNATFTSLDSLDGGAGNDILNINNTSALDNDKTDLSVATIKNIETINVQAVGDISNADAANGAGTNEVDFSTISGLTTLNTTKSVNALVKAAATTDVNVSGATGLVSIEGGKNVSVTDATAAKAITVGETGAVGADAAGTITITDTNNSGANAIVVEGGTDVTVTATAAAQMTAGITVGSATNGTATGNVVITQNSTSDGAVIDHSAQTIAAVGGKTISITQNLTNTADIQTDSGALSGAKITATADDKTTDVTITQNATNTIFTKPAVELVKASQAITFKDLASGKTVTIDNLVFTAAKDLTAAEVAAAFANLTVSDTQSEGGITTNGIYTVNSTANFTSGAANGATVIFTGIAHNTTKITPASSATASVPTEVYTLGTAAAAAVPSTNSVVLGSVVVDDNATKSIENITVNGATTVTLGDTSALNALKTLSLTNVTGATKLDSTAKALDLTLNKVGVSGTAVAINLDDTSADITDLTLTTTGTASYISTFAAVTVKNLTIDAGAALTISTNTIGTTPNTLETVTIKGTAAVDLATVNASTSLKSFNASANTGGVTATITATTAGSHADLTTFVFSEGNDVVTTTGTAVNKKINLGSGDDKITLGTGTQALAAAIDAGAGTADTLSMAAADLTVVTNASTAFADKISNFEKVTVGAIASTDAAAATMTLDLANLDNISYVNVSGITAVATGGTATGGTASLAISKLAANGTVNLTGAILNDTDDVDTASLSIALADATGSSDVLNLAMTSAADAGNITNTGVVTAAGIETINISVSDLFVANAAGTDTGTATHTLILTADAAKTIDISGNSNLTLTLTGSDKVTMIDGSDMTGVLTATTAVSTAAATIKGGSAADKLTATSNDDILFGNAGADTLSVANSANLVSLNGGEGKDIYQIGTTSNQNAYATINGTDSELSGDVIQFGATGATAITSFVDAKITLAGTAVFQDYVNAAAAKAVAASANLAGTVSYFQFDGSTYLVQDNTVDNTTFVAGDSIVKIAGLVDFTFNDAGATGTLEIA